MARSKLRAYLLGLIIWVGAFFMALKLGAVDQPSFELIATIRLPRAILATALGVGLAVAGAVLQALFLNPLCEPYTLGISSGSALGAVVGATLGIQGIYAGLAGPAFMGAMIFSSILYLISKKMNAGNMTLLLTGVMLGFFGNSLVALWIALSDTNGIQSILVWMLGDLSRARLHGALFTSLGVGILCLLIWRQWRSLDGFLLGEEEAEAIGIDSKRVRRQMILFTSLLIGLCVSAGGMIGFVGLVIPHFTRRRVGSLHLHLIPLAAIWGAVALTTADWVSRVLVRPYELPVGVVTALLGAPVFLWVMLKRQRFA
jgi:iron complex transport system permease protein